MYKLDCVRRFTSVIIFIGPNRADLAAGGGGGGGGGCKCT